ncbi:uncharacterized protein LOC118428446 [Branchiostoma floridae]|uniref:Uncharacterized protein LOC118428446 n=1 Tax=Branchiostoma floridae TaxID=7739 RepID=A0A9J7M453_BRAFL|nr:uncharacterized protein LOC118428446 [Branchiostoma floridae]
MPMMRWGNITLNITSERSTSETGLDLILTAGLVSILLWSLAFIVLLILGIWSVCSECNWIQIFCPKSACTRMASYTIESPDLEFCVTEIPTAEDMIKTISQEVQSSEQPLDLEGQIHQPEAIPGPMMDNPCIEDSETICEGKPSEGKIKSSSFAQKENKTRLKLKTEKRIDSHNGSLELIQAISDRMVDIESLVNPTALSGMSV